MQVVQYYYCAKRLWAHYVQVGALVNLSVIPPQPVVTLNSENEPGQDARLTFVNLSVSTSPLSNAVIGVDEDVKLLPVLLNSCAP